jgi:hypothetical protein
MKYKVRAYHKPGKMNQLEKSYANHLALLKAAGEIEDFAFEPEKLKLSEGCYYIPDFRVISKDMIQFKEVKAAWKVKGKPGEVKPHFEDDALVKLKVAASGIHPYQFFCVWLENGSWQEKEF